MAVSRRTLIERIDRFLTSIETRGVEPSRWEGHCIRMGLEAFKNGDIQKAETDVALAKTPPELRTSSMLIGFSHDSRNPTLAELRAELKRIEANTVGPGDES